MADLAIGNRQSEILIGSRASKLALTQAHTIGRALSAAHPGLTCRIVHIQTTGDRRRTEALPAIGGKGLFTQEIEQALLDGRIALAVHSLKDLPTELPPGLAVAAVPVRVAANDALISADARPLAELPEGARVGTSSLRRAAQLRRARPDLRPENIRGNVDTRLRKLREGQFDAIVLALAGLERLGLAHCVTEVIPFHLMLPAPGQGAIAIEACADNAPIMELAAAIGDAAATAATAAERTLLETLGGGCSLPLGAYAQKTDPDTLRLRAILLTPDGAKAAQAERTGPAADPAALAHAVAADLRADGADAILKSLPAD